MFRARASPNPRRGCRTDPHRVSAGRSTSWTMQTRARQRASIRAPVHSRAAGCRVLRSGAAPLALLLHGAGCGRVRADNAVHAPCTADACSPRWLPGYENEGLGGLARLGFRKGWPGAVSGTAQGHLEGIACNAFGGRTGPARASFHAR